jgi:hypothetical protein
MLVTYIEAYPVYRFFKFGPNGDDVESETQILSEYFGLTSREDIPHFIVISSASFSLTRHI